LLAVLVLLILLVCRGDSAVMAGDRVLPMGLSWCLIVTLLLPVVEPGKFKCPSFTKLTDDEFVYPDPEQCDKYWTCVRGESKRSLCPDGLVFHPGKAKGEDPCDQRQNVPDKCEGRSGLQRPKPGDAHCPRQNGVYASDDPYECDTYYSCLNGKSSPTKCAVGLHYSDEIGTCVWPRESGRDDCITEDEEPRQRKKKQKGTSGPDTTTRKPAEALDNGFKCPGGPIGVHPALPHPKDCRLYYVCLDGITPSAAGCTHGKVFNPTTQQCDIPTNVEGCEFYYNPAAKKKKEEQEKKLANIAGAEVTSNDFNQFLKLLKMSGVLGGGGNSVNEAFKSGLGGNSFNQGLRKGPSKGPLAGRRKRPKNLRQRPGRQRKRPLRPQQFDYYDYASEYDYEYDEPPPRKRPKLAGSSPAKRPIKQRNRPSGKLNLETNVESSFVQTAADLKDPVRVTPIRPTQLDKTPPSVEPSPQPTSSQGLFSIPQSRKNIFTSKFIPKVKAVGDLENIHPTGFSQSAKGATVTEREVKSPNQPAKTASVPQLSGPEAANLFNSLFPTLVEESVEELPVPQPIVAPEPVVAQAIVTPPTIEEKPRRPLLSSPLSRPISRASLFNRRPPKSEITTLPPVKETPVNVEEIAEVVTTTAKSQGILGRAVSGGRKSIFSTRNRLRTRPSLLRKAEEAPTTQPPQIVTEVVTVPEVFTTERVKAPVLRSRHRFPFSPTPTLVKDSLVNDDINEDNVINTDNLVEITPRSVLKANPLSPRKSFRSLLKSRMQNRLPVTVPMKDKSPAAVPVTTPPEPVHLPDPVVPQIVTESHSLIPKQIPISQTQISQRKKIENTSVNRRTFSAKIEPAFINPVRASPIQVTAAPVTHFEEATSDSSSHLENLVRSRSRARGRSNSIVSQDQIVSVEQILEPQRFPKGRSSVVSAPLDTVAERERQRIVAHKVRNQIKDYLPEAENEGDAYEKLRAKIERIKNRNKARGRG